MANPHSHSHFVPVSLSASTSLTRGRNLRRLTIGYASGASPWDPPHPALIAMAQEPLGLRCLGFSPRFARTHSGILTSCRSRPTFPRALPCYRNAPLPLTHGVKAKL